MAIPILVVDDSAMSRKLVIKALPQEWDVEIHQASNGQEALDVYKTSNAQIMLLDLTMPVMDGFEVLENLQREGQKPFVIVISADVQPKAQERVMELGAIAFLKKPIKTEEIKQVLKEHGVIQ
jgi:two-component system, chemotaxis family, chemotaxis protein CheY